MDKAKRKWALPKPKRYMAVDQYGTTYHGLVEPRRDLLARLGRSHADRMFMDKTQGPPVHVGYIITGLWLTLYEVVPVEWPMEKDRKKAS